MTGWEFLLGAAALAVGGALHAVVGELLGAYTLEGLRLAVDPASLALVPSPNAWA